MRPRLRFIALSLHSAFPTASVVAISQGRSFGSFPSARLSAGRSPLPLSRAPFHASPSASFDYFNHFAIAPFFCTASPTALPAPLLSSFVGGGAAAGRVLALSRLRPFRYTQSLRSSAPRSAGLLKCPSLIRSSKNVYLSASRQKNIFTTLRFFLFILSFRLFGRLTLSRFDL